MSTKKAGPHSARQLENRQRWPKKILVAVTVFLFLGLLSAQLVFAKQAQKKVLLVTLSAITPEDLNGTSTPNIDMLAEQGAMGLMNVRAIKTQVAGSFYLSIGAGARAEASLLGNMGLNATELTDEKSYNGRLSAKDFYMQNNSKLLGDDAVYNLGAMDASARNFKYRNNIVPGLLGETLKKSGLKTAVVGNADTLDRRHREISLVAMDLSGKVSAGDVSGDLNIEDKSFPGGLRTNYKKLLEETVAQLDEADFVALELGDTARLDFQRSMMSDEINDIKRAAAIRRADSFMRDLVREIDTENTLIVLVSPMPQKDAMLERDFITPIVVSGAGKGVLTSNTTRRSGLVANLDLAPTIAGYLGARLPAEMGGNKITASNIDEPYEFLEKKHSHVLAMRMARTPIIVTYALFLLAGLVLAILAFRQKDGFLRRKSRWIKTFLIFLMAMPISGMLQIPLTKENTFVALSSLVAIAVAITAVVAWVFKNKPLESLFLLAGATTVLIVVDSLTGTTLSQRSFFGSDLIAGGRYYGLGNVYMGILIGAATFSVAAAIELMSAKDKKNYLLPGLFFLLLVAIVIGHSRAGANIGGLITASITALIFGQVVSAKKLGWTNLGVNLAVFTLVVVFAMGLGFPKGGTESHIGKALSMIENKGTVAINDIIVRKLRQNIRGTLSLPGFLMATMMLMGYSLNSILKKDGGVFRRVEKNFPTLGRAFMVLAWASIIGLAVNDTGAITAVAIGTYFLIPLLFILLSPKVEQQKV